MYCKKCRIRGIFLNLKDLNLGEKIILGGAVVSILSLFLPWVDIGFVKADGFQQQGYIMILFWLYPCVQAVMQKKPIKMLSIILDAVAILFMFYMLHEKSTSIFGASISVAASGMYLMIIALIVIMVGIILNNR